MKAFSFCRSLLSCAMLAGAAAALSCDSSTEPLSLLPGDLLVVSGDDQEGVVGTQLAEPLVVRVVDQDGRPLQGQLVHFVVVAGGGSVMAASAMSNAGGLASSQWILGTSTTAEQRVEARLTGEDTDEVIATEVFVATALAGPATLLSFAAAPPTVATNGALLPAIVVQLEDANGNAVAQSGVSVTASLGSGSGALAGTLTVATDAQGRATFSNLRLSGEPGEHALRFAVTGLTPATTPPIALSVGAPATIEIVAGDDQDIPAGTAAPVSPAVRVTDAAGSPVPGVDVIFALQSGVASPASAFRTTNENGIATLETWTVGTQVGSVSMTASVSGVPGVVFTAAIIAGAPASMTRYAGHQQSAAVGAAVATPPAVRVVDAHGNAVRGVSVTFTVTSGGGTVAGATATTDALGIATVGGWTLGPAAGEQTIQATAASLGAVTFTATALAGAATKLAFTTSPPNNAQIGVPMPPIVLELQDASGNRVASQGVRVTATLAGGNELRGNTSRLTDASGHAAFDDLTVYGVQPIADLEFSAPGLTGVEKSITIGTGGVAGLSKYAGDEQIIVAGELAPVRPAVRITDISGNGVPGVTVQFAIVSGGGALTGAGAVTDANGVASVGSWRVGTQAGSASLTATTNFQPTQTFTATIVAAAPASVAKFRGDGQSGTVNTPVGIPPAVRVLDAFGNAVAGATVTFVVASGGGSVTGSPALTDGNGIATVGSWTLGPAVGEQSLAASIPGAGSTTFTANAKGSASQLSLVSTPPASTTSGALLPPLVVQLEDASGTGVAQAGVTVTASLGSGTATLSGTLAVPTDAQGRATFDDLRLSGDAGQSALRFAVAGLSPVTTPPIAMSPAAGAPTTITIVAGDDQDIPAGTAAPVSPAVRVTDAAGSPVPGVDVIFALQSGVASPASAFRTTNENGIATLETWTVGTQVGSVSMTASVSGVPGVVFSATIVPAAPAIVAKHAGDAQNAQVGTAVAIPPAVRVTDAYGNVVSGVPVTFSVLSGGGSITGGTTTTDAQGIGTVGSWTLGTTPGAQALLAVAGSAEGVAFSATALAGAATKLAFVTPPPDNAQIGVRMPPIVVELQDASGAPVASAGVRVTATLAGGAELGGVTSVSTDASGRATFDDLTVYGYQQLGLLEFRAPGLTGVQKSITIGAGSGN